MDPAANKNSLTLARDGAQYIPGAVRSILAEIHDILLDLPADQAGIRIHGIATLRPLLGSDGAIGSLASNLLSRPCRAVRAILFDKTEATNWSLTWHQDRTICVINRIDVAGYDHWTVKGGMQHVMPPFDLLSRMLTLRIHLDDVPAGNSPLLVARGSHLYGCIPVDRYEEVVAEHEVYACLATAGDVWAYATPILHASEAATVASHRRVLQVDYSADELAGGLEWLGV